MLDTPQYEKGMLYNISIIDFRKDPNQPRKYFDPEALEELAASIKKHGILQPVLFRPDPGEQGWLTIVAGERRIEAAKIAGVNMIPALMVEGNADEIALVENLQRKDLMPVEEAEAIDRMMKNHNYNQEDLSGIVNKSQPMISKILSLNRLPQQIRDECRSDPTVPRAVLIAIAQKKQERAMLRLYNEYREKTLNREEIKKEAGDRKGKTAIQYVAMISDMDKRLGEMDRSAWTEDDNTAFQDALVNMRETFTLLLDPESPTPLRPKVKSRELL
ncbi:MAG: ParB/RepB/Spo0J family partition protein [Deltaproteobacteria bacterium]|nr:ParB/RepB/Spo0J family partition protein [Deltaproteobacteria bacterium]